MKSYSRSQECRSLPGNASGLVVMWATRYAQRRGVWHQLVMTNQSSGYPISIPMRHAVSIRHRPQRFVGKAFRMLPEPKPHHGPVMYAWTEPG